MRYEVENGIKFGLELMQSHESCRAALGFVIATRKFYFARAHWVDSQSHRVRGSQAPHYDAKTSFKRTGPDT